MLVKPFFLALSAEYACAVRMTKDVRIMPSKAVQRVRFIDYILTARANLVG